MLNLMLAWGGRDKVLQGNSDFIAFYTALQMIGEGEGERLYDLVQQERYQQRVLDGLGGSLAESQSKAEILFFINPPLGLVWFLPLMGFPYLWALLLWDFVSILCFAVGIAVLWQVYQPLRVFPVGMMALACLAFLPVWITFLQGQITGVMVLLFCLAFRDLKEGREHYSGFWVALALTKFQLTPPILILFLYAKRWRALAGFVAGGVAGLLVSLGLVGVSGMKMYSDLVVQMSGWVNQKGMNPSAMHCLRGQFNALWYESHPALATVAYVGFSLIFLAGLLHAWKRNWDVQSSVFGLKFALLIVVMILVSPHLNFHDLALLLIPGLLICGFATVAREEWRGVRRLACAVVVAGCPLMMATLIVSNRVPVQLSVCALAIVASTLVFLIRRYEQGREIIATSDAGAVNRSC
ncbi:MAG TPA: glycosyltransferase family 87 protein [Terriglobia bacterium]|nr:glycosyltransferase family 87 protein [Terriglobia bacterium]